jgi:hypothetical protein
LIQGLRKGYEKSLWLADDMPP